MLNQTLTSEPRVVIIPKSHLGAIIADYLFAVGALEHNVTIRSLNIPIEVDEEDNITIGVGVTTEVPN